MLIGTTKLGMLNGKLAIAVAIRPLSAVVLVLALGGCRDSTAPLDFDRTLIQRVGAWTLR